MVREPSWNVSYAVVARHQYPSALYNKKAETFGNASAFGEKELAATYSRGVYKTTTIGNTVFDGRVRNGNGSDHSFMATKKCLKRTLPGDVGGFL